MQLLVGKVETLLEVAAAAKLQPMGADGQAQTNLQSRLVVGRPIALVGVFRQRSSTSLTG